MIGFLTKEDLEARKEILNYIHFLNNIPETADLLVEEDGLLRLVTDSSYIFMEGGVIPLALAMGI